MSRRTREIEPLRYDAPGEITTTPSIDSTGIRRTIKPATRATRHNKHTYTYTDIYKSTTGGAAKAGATGALTPRNGECADAYAAEPLPSVQTNGVRKGTKGLNHQNLHHIISSHVNEKGTSRHTYSQGNKTIAILYYMYCII